MTFLECYMLDAVYIFFLFGQSCRLYATKHLRVLLRANVEFFSNWGIELLVTQLHDKNKNISSESLDILDEACEDKVIPRARKSVLDISVCNAGRSREGPRQITPNCGIPPPFPP